MWIFYAVLAGVILGTAFETTSALYKANRGWKKFVMSSVTVSSVSIFFLPFVHVDPISAAVAIAAGCTTGFSNVLYYMAFEHISSLTMSVSGQFMPVFVLISGWFVLGKEMGFRHVVAFFMIMVGSFVAAVQKADDENKESITGVFLFLGALAMASFFHLANSYVTNDRHADGLQVVVLNRVGMTLSPLVFLITSARKEMLGLFAMRTRRKFYWREVLGVIFLGLTVLSVAAKPPQLNPSLVNVIYYGACQITLFIYFALIKKQKVWQKAIGAVIASAGLVYLAMQK